MMKQWPLTRVLVPVLGAIDGRHHSRRDSEFPTGLTVAAIAIRGAPKHPAG